MGNKNSECVTEIDYSPPLLNIGAKCERRRFFIKRANLHESKRRSNYRKGEPRNGGYLAAPNYDLPNVTAVWGADAIVRVRLIRYIVANISKHHHYPRRPHFQRLM